MSNSEDLFKKIVSHCKEYGFIFQSSEIYEEGLAAVYDYGQMGVELKKNLQSYWWKAMTQLHDNVTGLDAAILMHPKTWKASGHIDSFNDPLIDNKDSKKRYRADVLLEDQIARYQKKGKDRNAEELRIALADCLNKNDLNGLRQLIIDHEIACPFSGTRNWTEVRQFNLMFSTQMSATSDSGSGELYLRPETAQGIFVNFLNVQKTGGMRIPFGIAQIGKAFRNEIVARQFLFRMREFEQMEMQFFVRKGEEMKWFEYWKNLRMNWVKSLGVPAEKLRWKAHDKLAHYANAAVDIEYEFPFGFKEIEGIHSRTDFDLSRHQEFSGKKIQYFDNEINQSYVPYVVETSAGSDRMFFMLMCNTFTEEKVKEGDKEKMRIFLKLPPALSPVKAAIFPLVKKDGLPEVGHKIMEELKYEFRVFYDERDSIGKRYTKQDLVGTPFCFTVDHQTLEDETVTVRHRDDMRQERLKIDALAEFLRGRVEMRGLLSMIRM